MYEHVYNFNGRPFTSTPFVKHYFAGEAIQQALGQSRICIDRASGPVIVVGATGTGKSILLAMLESEYQTQFNVVNLGCARLDERRDLWQNIMFELKLPFHNMSESELRFALLDYLKPSEQCPNGVLLLIDEAHSLSVSLLDELRLITNFVRDGIPRIRLVMAGNVELEEHLTDPKLTSLNQRIATHCYLTNMHQAETGRYVTEHIDRVGGDGSNLFTPDALKAIHALTEGCPRRVNQVCDLALILAGTRGLTVIAEDCIQEAWADVESIPGGFAQATESPDTHSVRPSDDPTEDWTVIEFGQLDDSGSHSDSDEQEDSSSSHVNTTVTKLDADNPPQHDAAAPTPSDHDHSCTAHPSEHESDQPCLHAEEQEDVVHTTVFGELPETPSIDHASNITDDELAQVEALENEQRHLLELTQPEFRPESECLPPSDSQRESESETDSFNPFVDEESHAPFLPSPELHQYDADDFPCVNADFPNINAYAPEASDVVSAPHVGSGPVEDAAPTSAPDSTTDSAAIHDPITLPVGQTVDPFTESFAEEEYLIDRFAPFVAHHNLSSLKVTAEDLESVVPLVESNTDLATPAPDPATEHEEMQEFRESRTPGVVIIEHVEDIDLDLSPTTTEASEPLNSVEDAITNDEPKSAPQELEYHSHATVAATEAIEQQAEEILKRLEQAQSVSCETTDENSLAPEPTPEKVEGSISETTPDEQPDVSHLQGISVVPMSNDDELDSSSPMIASLPSTEIAPPEPAIDETQQILNDILEQNSIIAEQHAKRFQLADDENLPIPTASEPVSCDATDGNMDDDREMIIVSRMEQQIETPSDDEAPLPFPSTPISTGRAKRMDYQQLFDQLRELPNDPESTD